MLSKWKFYEFLKKISVSFCTERVAKERYKQSSYTPSPT